ncbi:MAG: hypothetical protein ACREOH_02815 [Candidatus Entotheonellia bacterium]
MKARTDARTIAFGVQDHLHAKEVYEGAVGKAKSLGFQVAAEEIVPRDVTDFGPIIAKLKQTDPGIVFVSSIGIDDNATNRFIVQEMLTAWGLVVTEVASGAAAPAGGGPRAL